MSDLISRREAIKALKDRRLPCYMIEDLPPIEEKEGVRIIWQHQIDDLIKQIEDIPTIKESDTGKIILMGEGMKKEVIKILEEAKK